MKHPFRLAATALLLSIAFPVLASSGDTLAAPRKGLIPTVKSSDHVRGRRSAAVSAIVYSDFACTFCKQHTATMNSLLRAYRGKVSLVYRHFPLAIHPAARPAALAAECVARKKGNAGFWAFHDAIFREGASSYETVASGLGVRKQELARCMEEPQTVAKVEGDAAGGAAVVPGTPTTFLYDRKTGRSEAVAGAQPLETFRQAVERLLAE